MAMKNIPKGLKNYTLSKLGLSSDEVEEIAFQRRLICEGCEKYSEEPYPRCTVCGCSLAMKTRVEDESCPESKW